MYQVLIVDDEPIIRKGLPRFINWEQYGFQIAGDAANGREAVMFVKRKPVDVIITDIRMPEADGFEMIESMHQFGLFPYVIILSGYSEFDYARNAIAHEVFYYLLKPVQEKELIATLKRLYMKLQEREAAAKRHAMADEFIGKLTGDEAVRSIMKKMLYYLEDHLDEGQLLKALSDYAQLTPNYISRLFSEQFGVNYLQVVTDMRIEKAKKLLVRDLHCKIYEIADQVGYKDSHYFSKLFQQKTGMTPTEYREVGER